MPHLSYPRHHLQQYLSERPGLASSLSSSLSSPFFSVLSGRIQLHLISFCPVCCLHAECVCVRSLSHHSSTRDRLSIFFLAFLFCLAPMHTLHCFSNPPSGIPHIIIIIIIFIKSCQNASYTELSNSFHTSYVLLLKSLLRLSTSIVLISFIREQRG